MPRDLRSHLWCLRILLFTAVRQTIYQQHSSAYPQGYSRWNFVAFLLTNWDVRIRSLEATILHFSRPVASGRFTGSSIRIAVIEIDSSRRNFVSILSRSRVMPVGYFYPHTINNVILKIGLAIQRLRDIESIAINTRMILLCLLTEGLLDDCWSAESRVLFAGCGVTVWFAENELLLNANKSDFVFIGTSIQLCAAKTSPASLSLAPVWMWRTSWNRLVFPSNSAYIYNLCAGSEHILIVSANIRDLLKLDVRKTPACSIINARQDYCNLIIYMEGTPCQRYWSRNACTIHCMKCYPAAETITLWTTSTYSWSTADQTTDSPQVGYPDVQDTNNINAGQPERSDFRSYIGDQNVVAIGVSYARDMAIPSTRTT